MRSHVLVLLGLLFGSGVVMETACASDAMLVPPNCNESGFANALTAVDGSGGGTITFACGTLSIASTYVKSISTAVVIDGGGAISFDGGNSAPFFQVYASGTLTLRRLIFQHGGYSGGIHALENFGTLNLDQVQVLDNVSSRTPLANYGSLTVQDSSFTGNAANDATDGDGGGLANFSGSMTVQRSTFHANHAGHNGGAVYNGGSMQVENSTFNGNSSTLGGGAIYQSSSLFGQVSYATIVGNNAVFGAGVYNDGGASGSLTIAKSIVSANSTGNCDGVLLSGGYNLSDDGTCGGVFTSTGDANNQTLPMAALAYNGGPTQTMLLLAGNAAKDHVPTASCGLLTDQRNASRPAGSGCDSGALEVGGVVNLIFVDGFE